MDWGAYGPGLTASFTVGAFILGGLWRVGKWFGATQAQASEFMKEQVSMKADLAEIKADQKETKQSIIELRLENARRDGLGRDVEELKSRVHALEGKR